jgi:hypothetical protein
MQQKSQHSFMFLGLSLAPVDVDGLRFPTSVRHRVIPVSANQAHAPPLETSTGERHATSGALGCQWS